MQVFRGLFRKKYDIFSRKITISFDSQSFILTGDGYWFWDIKINRLPASKMIFANTFLQTGLRTDQG